MRSDVCIDFFRGDKIGVEAFIGRHGCALVHMRPAGGRSDGYALRLVFNLEGLATLRRALDEADRQIAALTVNELVKESDPPRDPEAGEKFAALAKGQEVKS